MGTQTSSTQVQEHRTYLHLSKQNQEEGQKTGLPVFLEQSFSKGSHFARNGTTESDVVPISRVGHLPKGTCQLAGYSISHPTPLPSHAH